MVAGCAQPPQQRVVDETIAPPTQDYSVCLVNDEQGVALLDAMKDVEADGVKVSRAAIASEADYAVGIQSMIDQGCQLVIGRGSQSAEAIQAAAEQNPEATFALIDSSITSPASNVRLVTFQVHQASFLAGYIAASVSKTGVVGTFGALDIPAVTIYMDGFIAGVAQWNKNHSDHQVKAVGWDENGQSGIFVQSASSAFDDPEAGAAAAQKLIDMKADVIFPVAGKSSDGMMDQLDKSIAVIGGDRDLCADHRDVCSSGQILTSVIKDENKALVELINAQRENKTSGIFSADLRNGGVKLADYSDRVGSAVRAEVDQLNLQIKDGTITISSASAVG